MQITNIESDWIKESIEKIEFLNFLFPQQILSLINHVTPRVIMGNQMIIKEGETGHPFFFIYNGRVTVWVERNKKRTKLATLKRGDFFGEISLLTGKSATANVVANAPTKVFFLDNDHFISLVRGNKKFAEHIVRVMRNRLTERKEAIETLRYGHMDEINNAITQFLGVPAQEEKKDENSQ